MSSRSTLKPRRPRQRRNAISGPSTSAATTSTTASTTSALASPPFAQGTPAAVQTDTSIPVELRHPSTYTDDEIRNEVGGPFSDADESFCQWFRDTMREASEHYGEIVGDGENGSGVGGNQP
ncbi:hypothetical protein RUND412_003819 [Rhizina undulata]